MKRGFIRGLWGIHDHQGRRFYTRRSKIDDDIRLVKHCKYNQPFMTYVFGEDNFKFLKSQGFRAKLVDKNPIAWDMNKEQFRHKLEVLKCGMNDFDQVIFLDWDQLPVAPLPSNFWDVLEKKQPIQAILRMYHRSKVRWRKKDRRKVPCASFVYIRDKKIPTDLIELWENMKRPWSEEIVIAKYMDTTSGGWEGIDKYWDLFEPDFFVLAQGRVYPKSQLATKNICFNHFNCHDVDRELRCIRANKLKDWQIK